MYRRITVPIPEGNSKVTLKRMPDGNTYVYYEYAREYRKDKKYTVPRRACIGKVDPRDPSRMYPNEKSYEYFPSEGTEDFNTPANRSSCMKVGTHAVLGWLDEGFKIGGWLRGRFGDKDGGLIMDLASYLIITETNSAQHYPSYAYNHALFTPDMRIYSDSKVGRLFSEVSRDDAVAFTEWWNGSKDHRRKIYVSYDSSNKYCQAGDIDMVECGHSKRGVDGEPIFNLSIAFDVKTRLPLFYEDYLGSIVDVSQLDCMVDKAKALGYRNLGFILDRGYFSRGNIEYLDKNGYPFLLMVKGRKALVSSLVLGVKGSFEDDRECFVWEYSANGTTVEARLYEGDRRTRFFHIFYSAYRCSLERSGAETMLARLAQELERYRGKDCSDIDMEKYEQFFDLSFLERAVKEKGKERTRRILVMFSEKTAVTQRLISLCGYFCIVSSDRMTAREALVLYKSRDGSEKLFAADKTFIGSRSARVRSEKTLRAKTFVEFIALILRSQIYSQVCDHVKNLRKKRNYLNVVSVVEELEKIELLRVGDGKYHLDHAITARQKEILSIFGKSDSDMKQRCGELAKRLCEIDSAGIRTDESGRDVRDDASVEDEEEPEWQE